LTEQLDQGVLGAILGERGISDQASRVADDERPQRMEQRGDRTAVAVGSRRHPPIELGAIDHAEGAARAVIVLPACARAQIILLNHPWSQSGQPGQHGGSQQAARTAGAASAATGVRKPRMSATVRRTCMPGIGASADNVTGGRLEVRTGRWYARSAWPRRRP